MGRNKGDELMEDTRLRDKHSEVRDSIERLRDEETEFWKKQLNTPTKIKNFQKWLREITEENLDVQELNKTTKKIMAVGCLALMPHYEIRLDPERGWTKFSELLTHIVPKPDSPRWEGRNISTHMYADTRRLKGDGLIEYLYEKGQDAQHLVGLRLTVRGLLYGIKHRTIGQKTVVEWWKTQGKGPNAEKARWPSVLRGGDEVRNRLAIGTKISEDIYFHTTPADQPILDFFNDNALQMAQQGVYTATAIRNQDPKTRRNVSQITECLINADAAGTFSYLWQEHKEMVVDQIIKMAEGDDLTPRATTIIRKSLMSGDVLANLYAYYSDHLSAEDPELIEADRDDEINELILRVVWTIIRRIMDYRMNNIRHAPHMKTQIYGPELEAFLHKIARAEVVTFEDKRDPDGNPLSYDILLDDKPYDLRTLKEKDESTIVRPF
jgi:hypothetical protein